MGLQRNCDDHELRKIFKFLHRLGHLSQFFLFSIGASENGNCQSFYKLHLHRLGGTLAIFLFSAAEPINEKMLNFPP
jgi:hypothetical protein